MWAFWHVLWRSPGSSHYLLLALLFGVGLELIFALQRWVIAVAVVVASVVTIGVILVRIEEQGRFRPVHSILPILAAVGFSGFALLLPTTPILHFYVLSAGILLFWLLKHGVRSAYPLWNWSLSLIIYFLNIAFILGLRFHLYMPIVGLLLLAAALSWLMSFQALERIVPAATDRLLSVMALTFVLSEAAWVLQFLPSHYLLQAGIMTTLYYVIFNLVSISYMRRIARRDIVEYIGIGMIACLLILISAQWS
jgi:hypothetical protein